MSPSDRTGTKPLKGWPSGRFCSSLGSISPARKTSGNDSVWDAFHSVARASRIVISPRLVLGRTLDSHTQAALNTATTVFNSRDHELIRTAHSGHMALVLGHVVLDTRTFGTVSGRVCRRVECDWESKTGLLVRRNSGPQNQSLSFRADAVIGRVARSAGLLVVGT